MDARILGLETEYGCLLKEGSPRDETSENISRQIKNTIFQNRKLGLLDLHYRGHDEPPGNGGFILNGGRVYLDMGHLEYATPECINLADLVAHDRAGDLILQEAIEAMGLSDRVSIIKNNVDHQTGATFGSHENYLVGCDFPFSYDGLGQMMPFLVTRQIFTGAGRVGVQLAPEGWVVLGQEKHPPVRYQISQRADHIVNDFYQWVQFNRAIINTRNEPLADPSRFRRIHLLLGDSNMLEYAVALKFGTTSLVLSLIEAGAGPEGLALLNPVFDLKQISRDQKREWLVTLENGKKMTAIEVQEAFFGAAEKHLKGKDADTDWTINEWGAALEALAGDQTQLIGKVDWISKEWLLQTFLEAEGSDWDETWMASLDLEYHNLNRTAGLSFALEEENRAVRRTTDDAIALAMSSPPRNTRASGRGELIRALRQQKKDYVINWANFYIGGKEMLPMEDPFKTYTSEAQIYLNGSSEK